MISTEIGFGLTPQFKLEFVPLEDDLLSLEMDDVARDIYLVNFTFPKHSLRQVRKADKQKGDETAIYYSSLALMTFQRAFGLFPRIMGKGDGAQVSISAHSWCRCRLMGIPLMFSETCESAQTPSCVRCHPI